MKDPMLNEEFLHELDLFPHKFIWAKIIALNWDEYTMQEITGKITSGSINVDGNSSIRRTCNLTLVANDVDINDFYWSLNTKFKVEIGIENWINPDYPEIIWFKQGTFIISSFSCSVGVNSYSINIQGKDKMVLLNGEVGGVVPASWDFGKIDTTTEDGAIEQEFYPIKDIILQAVHEYTQDGWENIIVNDLDDYGIELLEYSGSTPLYYLFGYSDSSPASRETANMTLNGDMPCWVRKDSWEGGKRVIKNNWVKTKLSQVESVQFSADSGATGAFSYEKLMEELDPSGSVTETQSYLRAVISLDNPATQFYTVAKITNNSELRVCGYRVCDIVYPYDLIAAPGDTITSVFDKIIQMLGNFEYFYDIDGRFIFQKKRTYLDVSYNNIINEHSISDEVWANSSEFSSKYSYTFDKDVLISSFQNSPNLSNLKNDYSLWGVRKAGDIEVPIHMRYAIDHKPYWYKNYDGEIYTTEEGWKKYRRVALGEIVDDEDTSKIVVKRSKNLDGLSDDWWKIDEWATYYAYARILSENKDPRKMTEDQIRAYYPDKRLWEYGSSNINYPTLSEVAAATGYASAGADVKAQIALFNNTRKTVSTHFISAYGYGCSHLYTSFLPSGEYGINSSYNGGAYIFKPSIPAVDGITTDIIDNIEIDTGDAHLVDWREIIYQMAKDYRRNYRENDFLIKIRDNNQWTPYYYVYPKGYTGYEKYYIDFEMNLSQGVLAYWRELYNPECIGIKKEEKRRVYYKPSGDSVLAANTPAWTENKAYNLGDYVLYKNEIYKSGSDNNTTQPDAIENDWVKGYYYTYNIDGWNPDILDNPETLNFWFDFLDTDNEIGKYSVCNIGQRSKATNDDKIKSIYSREVPNVIFRVNEDDTDLNRWKKPGYSIINIPSELMKLFNISSRGKNAMDVIEDYLYSYTYPAASVTLNAVPIYYLEPNTLIYVNDEATGTVGEYIMQKFSIQLGTTSQMSISAVETAKRIY